VRKFKRPVVALGVFDGVHRGHRKVLEAAVKKARAVKGKSIALTFWPHPHGQESIFSLRHRLLLLEELAIDAAVVVRFSPAFSRIPAEDFVRNTLVKKLAARYIYVGDNFRFGKDSSGDLALLRRLSGPYGFRLRAFRTVSYRGRPVSSTLIRGLIRRGELKMAARLLRHPVSVLGSVKRGTALGRLIGFPTANIDPHHEVIPPSGIYAVRVALGEKRLKGACYIGTKPTLRKATGHRAQATGREGVSIEVHIINFRGNIYGKYLEIQFVKKIRPDRRFASLALLSRQIRKDAAAAAGILS
jgi:riboflavin kinase/FMN adenylyltransferase